MFTPNYIEKDTPIIKALNLWSNKEYLLLSDWLNQNELNELRKFLFKFELTLLTNEFYLKVKEYANYLFEQRLSQIFTGPYRIEVSNDKKSEGIVLYIYIFPIDKLNIEDYIEDDND